MNSFKDEHLDYEAVQRHLDVGNLAAALVVVCAYAETARRYGRPVIPPADAGEPIRELLERIYSACIADKAIEEYALFYQATRYVPHGSQIQPIMEQVMRHFSGRIAALGVDGMAEAEKDVLRIFIDLSLEAYDKLGSFRVFLSEFREFIPFSSLPKAIAIARSLGDDRTVGELSENLLHPPAELDQSRRDS